MAPNRQLSGLFREGTSALRSAQGAIVERVERSALAALDTALNSRFAEQAVNQVLESRLADQTVKRVIDSDLLDEVVARLLRSEELWVLVDEIAQSDSVAEAISQQSRGLADQVAGEVRTRSSNADARLERIARRILRRRERGQLPPGPPVAE